MNLSSSRAAALLLSAGATLAQAQTQDFPAGAATPNAGDIRQHLADKVFGVDLANGQRWRLEFKSRWFYVDASNGRKSTGEWQADDGRLCTKLNGTSETSCSEVRMHAGLMFVKRAADGEVIRYDPR